MEHHVYFWLTEEHQNEADLATFEAGLDALCESPNISVHHWGKPAATAVRPVTDNSFDYALSLKFDTMESHDRYQENDSRHDEFVNTFKEWWAKALVMDVA